MIHNCLLLYYDSVTIRVATKSYFGNVFKLSNNPISNILLYICYNIIISIPIMHEYSLSCHPDFGYNPSSIIAFPQEFFLNSSLIFRIKPLAKTTVVIILHAALYRCILLY